MAKCPDCGVPFGKHDANECLQKQVAAALAFTLLGYRGSSDEPWTQRIPSYPHDIAAATEALVAMGGQYCRVEILRNLEERWSGKKTLVVATLDRTSCGVTLPAQATDDNIMRAVPLAVCRAICEDTSLLTGVDKDLWQRNGANGIPPV